MNELLILVTLYCGTPVSVAMDIHRDGKHEFIAGAIPKEDREFWKVQLKDLESRGAQIRTINAEEVLELSCPVKA